MNIFVLILLTLIIISFRFNVTNFFKINDGFTNYNLEAIHNNDISESDLLVKDIYPPIGRNGISNDNSSDVWWHKPVFTLGSYKQITNNIRYSNNPDIGSCAPVSMCGALYHDKQEKTNYVDILPQINPNCGRRVGYFDTDTNLLPYKTDTQNILF
jgi:hypothetical protein